MTRLRLLPALIAFAALPAATSSAATPASCPGTPIAPSKTITGSFPASRQGSEVLLPFSVPKGTTAVRVKYCWDKPERSAGANDTHVLDLGLYGPRRGGDKVWGVKEFRGWGGSSHPDVIVSPRGFSSRAQYLKAPKTPVPGRTTRGFLPGPHRSRPVGGRPRRRRRRRPGRRRPERRGVAGRHRVLEGACRQARRLPQGALLHRAGAAQGGLVRRRHARARRELGARRRDDEGGLRLRVQDGQARLHHALGLRDVGRLGRDRPLPGQVPRPRDRPLGRGDHLPRAHDEPRERAPRGLPHRRDPRAPGERRARPGARGAARLGDPPRRPRRRRLDADQPPDDLQVRRPGGQALLPRLPVGLHRRADRLRQERRRDRGRHRPGRLPPGGADDAQPVRPDRDRVLRARARARRPRRRGRLERRPSRRRGRRPDRDPGGQGGDRRLRRLALARRPAARRRVGSHLREDVRPGRPRPAADGTRAGRQARGDLRRHRGGIEGLRSAPA